MSKFQLREEFVAKFEQALRNAGMQSKLGTDTDKPRYWRGQVDDTNDALFLLYVVTEPIALEHADNKLVRQQLFLNGEVFTRNGFTDSDYQDLCHNIEVECEKLKLTCTFSDEGRDNSLDTESPIYYINFEVDAEMLNK
jgi:hypothetical protein